MRKPTSMSMLIGAVALVAAVGGAVAAATTIRQIGRADRSGFTQAHGIRAVGESFRVRNHQSCDGLVCHWNSTLTVSLDRPVAGQAVTTAHTYGPGPARLGQRETVVIDPRDPGYAEVAGRRDVRWLDWIQWATVTAACVLFLAVVMGWSIGDRLRRAVRRVR